MDGVIFDTEALYRNAVIRAADECGVEIPVPVYLDTIGLPGSDVRMRLQLFLGGRLSIEELWKRASGLFDIMVETELRLKAGLPELLVWLEKAGMRSAIVTSSDRATVLRHLRAMELEERFDLIVARGDYAAAKPHPEPYLNAARSLGLPAGACIAIEDSHNGVRSASGAGAMTVMVPDLIDPTPEIERLCNCVVDDLHAARELIASAREDDPVA